MDETPDSLIKTRESLKETVLESYHEEYKEIVSNWRGLETKAQGSVTIAGIFIAGAFAYLRENITYMNFYLKIILAIGIIYLIMSVIFSILALKITSLPGPPIGSYLHKLGGFLFEENEADFLNDMQCFLNDQIKAWQNVNTKLANSNLLKARKVWIGQILLVAAILIVGILVFFSIIT